MSDETIKDILTAQMKKAMKDKDKDRLGVIRMALSALKQVEVDERITLENDRIIAILDKMVKQRRESAKQYKDAGRTELEATELMEISILQEFLPAALTEDELTKLIETAIADSGASGMQDMGKVMGLLKPQVQGRADMGQLSGKVKALLNA